MTTIQLETFRKLPLGGVSPRLMAQRLAADGASVAREDLARARAAVRPSGVAFPDKSAVLMLGGSGGILRALAIQLLFGERVPVYAVHYDSEKLQIGSFHARALAEAAEAEGVRCRFLNADATKPEQIQAMLELIRQGEHRCIHFINGIAAGATKRFAEHGTTQVRDLDIAFDPARQTADFSAWDSIRRFGLVDVEVASDAEIERTYKFMGHSSDPWVDALHGAGLLVAGQSLVSFTDYEYEPDDPVYALGPLAQAKVLQRKGLERARERTGARVVRLCYPAMNTTALGAIPGGTLLFAGTSQVLLERGCYRNIPTLAAETLPIFSPSFASDALRVDLDFQQALPEFHRRKVTMHSGNLREHFDRVIGNHDLLPARAPQMVSRNRRERAAVRASGATKTRRILSSLTKGRAAG